MTAPDRLTRYLLDYRRARAHWWKYRPAGWVGAPDPVLLAAMEADGLFEQEET